MRTHSQQATDWLVADYHRKMHVDSLENCKLDPCAILNMEYKDRRTRYGGTTQCRAKMFLAGITNELGVGWNVSETVAKNSPLYCQGMTGHPGTHYVTDNNYSIAWNEMS